MCFELLAWLKLEKKREKWISEGKRSSLKPLELKSDYDWCNLVQQIIDQETIFSEIFEIDDNKLYFKSTVAEELKNQLRKDAYLLYNPPINT